jgi:hypothetical protein
MERLPHLLLVACLALVAAYVAGTSGELPARVASHFGADNLANGWMTREGYRTFVIAFAVGLPALLAAFIGLLPRAAPSAVNLPNRGYWFDPRRREETLSTLARFGSWLGIIVALFLAGIHFVVLEANRVSPARMPAPAFWTLMALFALAMILWVAALTRRFRSPD